MFQLLLSTVALAGALATAPVAIDTATFNIDKGHSELTFRIRHIMSRVSGTFTDWKGTITGDPAAWSGGSTEIVIQTTSIDTRLEKRDMHLRSADFFDAANHPEITFKSTSVVVAGSAVTLRGQPDDPWCHEAGDAERRIPGNRPARARNSGSVFMSAERSTGMDYGVAWNKVLDTGGVMLGDDVDLDISVEAVRA